MQKSAALVALDDALNELAGFDPRKARIAETGLAKVRPKRELSPKDAHAG